jgi:hypothetical protein
MRSVFLAGLLLVAATSSGCAGTSNIRERAASDLDCSEESLIITELGRTTRAVEGCGRQAAYFCRDAEAGQENCDEWVRKSNAAAK